MISAPITLDGVTYPHLHVMSIKRNFSVLDSDLTGRAQAGNMIRDIIGTFYNYSVEIQPDASARAEYDSFYQVISAPVEFHTLVVPYAQTTLTFEAYVTQGSDELTAMEPSANRWEKLSFNFIAMAPQRTPA